MLKITQMLADRCKDSYVSYQEIVTDKNFDRFIFATSDFQSCVIVTQNALLKQFEIVLAGPRSGSSMFSSMGKNLSVENICNIVSTLLQVDGLSLVDIAEDNDDLQLLMSKKWHTFSWPMSFHQGKKK